MRTSTGYQFTTAATVIITYSLFQTPITAGIKGGPKVGTDRHFSYIKFYNLLIFHTENIKLTIEIERELILRYSRQDCEVTAQFYINICLFLYKSRLLGHPVLFKNNLTFCMKCCCQWNSETFTLLSLHWEFRLSRKQT